MHVGPTKDRKLVTNKLIIIYRKEDCRLNYKYKNKIQN